MLAFAALAAIIPALVAGQGAVPACALTCTLSLAGSSACGGVTNITCLCTNEAFQAEVFQCYVNTCSETDRDAAIAYGAQTCQSVGVTLNTSAVPAGVTSSGAASSAGSSSASGSAASTTPTASQPIGSSSSAAPVASTSTTGAAAGSFVRGKALITTVAAMVGVAAIAAIL